MSRTTNDDLAAARTALAEHGSIRAAALATGMSKTTFHRLAKAAERQIEQRDAGFEVSPEAPIPSPHATIEELLERRKREFARIDAAKTARKLIAVAVKMDGPVGIAHFGDPHVDDPGCDIAKLERHIDLVNRTPGLFAANIGDMHNNWVGRLGAIYAEQSTSALEAWQLVEWMMRAAPWLYVIGGNHDVWSGAGDPLRWMTRTTPGVFENHGVRLNLTFPNGRAVRVNARHDFKGHSQWNAAHGVAKAAQMGWRDHILVCGHLHISGYQVLKDPATGLISHALRVASYKTHDRYADKLGLPDQNISACAVTIIDPEARDEVDLVTVFQSVERAADYLTWLRQKRA